MQRERDGLPVPALEKRPALMIGLDFYLRAYHELSYDRPIGMTLGPIPWSSVDRYAAKYGIVDLDDFSVFESHIRAMENAVYHHDKSLEAKGPK